MSLCGASECLLRHADLAGDTARNLQDGHVWEKQNLAEIEARLRHVSTERPKTFIEAMQLLFGVHCCIHLIGESTALGRLDQVLAPHLETDLAKGAITLDDADVLRQFADGQSSNILTITVATPDTLNEAITHPKHYDLLRVRTGGWSNFFTSIFPGSQQQYRHRPLSSPE